MTTPAPTYRPARITAPMTDNLTFIECRACQRTWQVPARPGVIHDYVDACEVCATGVPRGEAQ